MTHPRIAVASVLAALSFAAHAADPALPEPAAGFLCCNMRTDGSWISDANYAENGKKLLPAGTPLKATGFGRYRVYVEIDGGKQALGNDYSRNLDLTAFAKRYIVAEDPAKAMAGFSPKVRKAIGEAKVVPGMTRQQVLMSLGYPMGSENPSLDARLWRYWLSSFQEFQVVFEGDKVKEVATGDPTVRNLVVAD
jgi:hypothetical protein